MPPEFADSMRQNVVVVDIRDIGDVHALPDSVRERWRLHAQEKASNRDARCDDDNASPRLADLKKRIDGARRKRATNIERLAARANGSRQRMVPLVHGMNAQAPELPSVSKSPEPPQLQSQDTPARPAVRIAPAQQQRAKSAITLQRWWRRLRAARATTRQLVERYLASGLPHPAVDPLHAQRSLPDKADIEADSNLATPTNASPEPAFLPEPGTVAATPAAGCLQLRSPPLQGKGLQHPPAPHHSRTASDRARYDAFDALARAVQSPATLAATAALLQRCEEKLVAAAARLGAARQPRDLQPQLRRLLTRRAFAKGPADEAQLPRYPARCFLCAYMVTSDATMVSNHRGQLQAGLQAAAHEMLAAFDALLSALVVPAGSGGDAASCGAATAAAELLRFDEAWVGYLQLFTVWKVQDAKTIEDELVGMAVELEGSMRRKLGPHALDSMRVRCSPDMQAMIEQVRRDHTLILDRLRRLGGSSAVAHMEAELQALRANVEAHWPQQAGQPLAEQQ